MELRTPFWISTPLGLGLKSRAAVGHVVGTLWGEQWGGQSVSVLGEVWGAQRGSLRGRGGTLLTGRLERDLVNRLCY